MLGDRCKMPEWKIPPAPEVCQRSWNTMKLGRLASHKTITKTVNRKMGLHKLASQERLTDFTSNRMGELHIGQEVEQIESKRPNIKYRENQQDMKTPNGRWRSPLVPWVHSERRPATSPCQTAHSLLINAYNCSKCRSENAPINRELSPTAAAVRFIAPEKPSGRKDASEIFRTGPSPNFKPDAAAAASSARAMARGVDMRAPAASTLQVPARREGTPLDRKRFAAAPEAAETSAVYYLNQEVVGTVQQRRILVLTEDDSDEYDTDCEPEIARDFRPSEFFERQSRLDVDIGHLTYEKVCLEGKVKPRRLVLKQLLGEKLDLRHAGLSTPEVKAISAALEINSRVQQVVMSDCHIVSEALCYIFRSLQENCFITQLNVSGSKMDVSASTCCCTMLTENRWLLALNLSNCSIGDNEVGPIAQGIKENHNLQHLNLSLNRISVSGGLLLGRALGQNNSLKIVNLSWNHIRAGGAVGLCNCLINNKCIEDLDLSWNGIGFEGCLALGESLRVNKVLKRLNLDNNRINWDCAPYISKCLNFNTSLEILELGQNPISMEGCEEILNAICKPSSKVRHISFAGIPINTKIALLATDIAKLRQFNLIHGGIFSSKDVLGIPRVEQEDPFSLLVRYMSTMGIRVMDLFRIFDKDNKLCVSKERFIQGLKRVRVPLDDEDILTVVKRLQLNKRGNISYQELATLVRNRIRDDRLEDKKQEIIQRKKREERKRILQSDKPLNAPSHFSFMPTLYSMYGARERESQRNIFSPSSISFSRPGSIYTPLPPIKRDKNYTADEMTFILGKKTPKTPETLVHRNAMTHLQKSPSINSTSLIMGYQGQSTHDLDMLQGTTYANKFKWRQAAHELFERQSFL